MPIENIPPPFLPSDLRHLKKEVAYRVKLQEICHKIYGAKNLDTLFTSNCFTNETGYIFLAQDLRQDTPQPEHTEALQIKKIPFTEAYQMVLDYEIKDAMAIIGILRVQEWLKKNKQL